MITLELEEVLILHSKLIDRTGGSHGIRDIELLYNFRAIDVEKIQLESISEDNPVKLVFKIAKKLLETRTRDEDIYNAKIQLAEELKTYDKVKNNEQIKALVDFLEYLFLIQDIELEEKYEEYKKSNGGVFKMTIDEIRRIHYTQKGKEEGAIKKAYEVARKLLDILDDETIADKTGLTVEEIKKLRNNEIKD